MNISYNLCNKFRAKTQLYHHHINKLRIEYEEGSEFADCWDDVGCDFFGGCDVPVLLVAVRHILDMVAEKQDHKPFSLILGSWFVANAKQLRQEEPGEPKKNSAIISTGTPILRGKK